MIANNAFHLACENLCLGAVQYLHEVIGVNDVYTQKKKIFGQIIRNETYQVCNSVSNYFFYPTKVKLYSFVYRSLFPG